MLESLIPSPLHPAIVHMPIALAMLVPIVAVVGLLLIRRGAAPRAVWSTAVATLSALLFSGWLALQTGEREEDRVERAVGESAIHSHEEAAEAFLLTTGIVLLVATGGLVRGRVGTTARALATVGTFAIVGAGWNVGHSGGELVYRHGAASAYTTETPARVANVSDADRPAERERGTRRDDDR